MNRISELREDFKVEVLKYTDDEQTAGDIADRLALAVKRYDERGTPTYTVESFTGKMRGLEYAVNFSRVDGGVYTVGAVIRYRAQPFYQITYIGK